MRLSVMLHTLLVGLAPVPGAADPGDLARWLADDPLIPGAVVATITSGGEAEIAVAGSRVAGGAEAVAEGDLWHVGSNTKSMTATLAARMVEAGLIDWTTTIGDSLGDAMPRIDPALATVTLEELLLHLSGMRANLGLVPTLRLGTGPRAAYVAQVLAAGPEGPRGGFLYSNAGYVVAGAMLEAAGGASWEDLVRDHVFRPLGMESAGFGPPQGDQPQGHRSTALAGLRPVGQRASADNIPALGPAGRVHLSASDMLRYLHTHLTRDAAFLSAEGWERLHRPQGPENYAMGWGGLSDGRLRHSGSNTMWFAQIWLDFGAGRAAFVAVNSGAMDRVRGPVTEAGDRLLAP